MANILVAYGSLTGNTQAVAERLANNLIEAGHQITLKNLEEIEPGELVRFPYVLIGSSTWDIGQLPFDTQSFFDRCTAQSMTLPPLQFAAFGCGDIAYDQTFCSAVDDLISLLTSMGAKNVQESLKIDGFPEFPDNIKAIEKWLADFKKHIV